MKRLIKKSAKQVGTLYHFTSLEPLLEILESNKLVSTGGYISFTRDQNFDKVYRAAGGSNEARISFDGDMMSENLKIEPYNDHKFLDTNFGEDDPLRFEYEERIKSPINNIEPFIIDITLNKNNGTLHFMDSSDIDGDKEDIKHFYEWVNKTTNGKFEIDYNKKPDIQYFAKNIQEVYGIPVNIK